MNTRQHLWLASLLGASAFLGVELNATPSSPLKRVSIIQIIEHPALNSTRQGILDELKPKAVKIDFQSAQGNSALATQIAQQFVGSDPAVLVGIGTSATQALMSANQYQKIPIVFSSVTDPKEAKLVINLAHPEGCVTGVSNYVDPELQFRVFQEILPKLSTLGIIYNPGEPNSVSLIKAMEKTALRLNLQLVLAAANATVEVSQATASLLKKVDAIFINNDNTALSAFDSIVKISTQHNLPVFASDTAMVKQGALAALGPDQYEVGRKTGKMIIQILAGEQPNNLPVVIADQTELALNRAQAEKLAITFPPRLLKRAERKRVPSHE